MKHITPDSSFVDYQQEYLRELEVLYDKAVDDGEVKLAFDILLHYAEQRLSIIEAGNHEDNPNNSG